MDILSAIPSMLLVIILVLIFDTATFSDGDAIGMLIICLLAFDWNVMPFTYLVSFLFKQPASAQRWVAMIYIFIGLFLFSMYVIYVQGNEDLWYFLFAIFPSFSLTQAIFGIASKTDGQSYYDSDVCGKPLIYMFIFGIVWFVVLLAIEYIGHNATIMMQLGLIPNAGKRAAVDIDNDVILERRRIEAMSESQNNDNKQDTVIVAGLRKVYQQGTVFGNGAKNVAVKDLWFGVPQGQCFGFLGVNGPGKTSALAMLTGERYPSAGRGYIHGCDIVSQQDKVRRYVGYCKLIVVFSVSHAIV